MGDLAATVFLGLELLKANRGNSLPTVTFLRPVKCKRRGVVIIIL